MTKIKVTRQGWRSDEVEVVHPTYIVEADVTSNEELEEFLDFIKKLFDHDFNPVSLLTEEE